MVESTAVSCIHPDNNSVDRIISKEEEREDPRRDSSIYLRVQNTVVFPHSTRTTVFPHAIQQLQVILHTELILPQEILQLQGSSRAVQYKASSSDCSRVSKHSTRQNPVIRPLQHKQASSNSTWQKQHSKRQPASTHSLQHLPGKLHRNPLGTTEFYQEK